MPKLTKNSPQKPFWDIKAAAKGVGEVYIYGLVTAYKWDDTDVTAADFKRDLDALGDIKTLNVYINSPGGSVFQGQAIYTILKRHTAYKNVYVDGLAASIASLVAMAGDTIFMPKNAMMMVHEPMNIIFMGNAQDFRKAADDLDKIGESMKASYMAKLDGKTTEEKLSELLAAETWLTAVECFEYGFCDELLDEKQIAASVDTELFARYKNVPENLLKMLQRGGEGLLNEADRRKLSEESKANLAKLNQILGGL